MSTSVHVFPYPGFDPNEVFGAGIGQTPLMALYHPKEPIRKRRKQQRYISGHEFPYLFKPRAPFPRTHVLPDVIECTLADILNAVADASGVRKEHIRGRRRYKPIARARFVFFWLARNYTGHSYPDLGHYLDIDHTSVLHAVRRVEWDHNEFRELVEDAKSALAERLEAKG